MSPTMRQRQSGCSLIRHGMGWRVSLACGGEEGTEKDCPSHFHAFKPQPCLGSSALNREFRI